MAYRYRSAITGEFVTEEFAVLNPSTIIKDQIDYSDEED